MPMITTTMSSSMRVKPLRFDIAFLRWCGEQPGVLDRE
jgi:hypothetical protein